MKRIVLILAVMLMPLSATAMKHMNETDLSNITCQSGVSIMIDVTMNIHFDIIAWGDPDGYGNNQGIQQVNNVSGSYSGFSESMVSDLPEMPYTIRVMPGSMTLTPGGTEVLLYKSIFNRPVLANP